MNMKIFELEQATGLDRATIRYYEKEGFITPNRMENGYRDYSEADQRHLLKIRLLRQLGMSLDRIRNLQQGSESFSAALDDQIRAMEESIQRNEQAKSICLEMKAEGATYDSIDAKAYLEKLANPIVAKNNKSTFSENTVWEEYHPIRRYVARSLDYLIINIIFRFFFIVILRIRPFGDLISNLIQYAVPFLAVPVHAWMLHKWGTTPGKWLLGIKVNDITGQKMTAMQAFNRECNALRYGYGFGIPFYRLWRMYKAYSLSNERKRMPWDEEGDTSYEYPRWTTAKKSLFAVTNVCLILLSGLCALDTINPTYRGDITIAQFAENYNDVRCVLKDDMTANLALNEDGTWIRRKPNGNVIVVGPTKTETKDYAYETVDGVVKRITFEKIWTDVFLIDPLNQEEVLYPMITVLLSQKGNSYFDLTEFAKLIGQYETEQSADFRYKNIQFIWKIKSTNCDLTDSGYISTKGNGTILLHLEIIIH